MFKNLPRDWTLVQPLQFRADLRVMTIKGYSTLPTSPESGLSSVSDTSLVEEDAVDVF